MKSVSCMTLSDRLEAEGGKGEAESELLEKTGDVHEAGRETHENESIKNRRVLTG